MGRIIFRFVLWFMAVVFMCVAIATGEKFSCATVAETMLLLAILLGQEGD